MASGRLHFPQGKGLDALCQRHSILNDRGLTRSLSAQNTAHFYYVRKYNNQYNPKKDYIGWVQLFVHQAANKSTVYLSLKNILMNKK